MLKYRVTLADFDSTCDCPAGRYGKMCKHLKTVFGAGLHRKSRPAVIKSGKNWIGGNYQGAVVGETAKDVMEAICSKN
jgi:hypothetical protein